MVGNLPQHPTLRSGGSTIKNGEQHFFNLNHFLYLEPFLSGEQFVEFEQIFKLNCFFEFEPVLSA
jgi:hypothetical protein